MNIPQEGFLSTIWLKMSHLNRLASDHGLCGTKLKISKVEVYVCIVWEFAVVVMAMAVNHVISVIIECDSLRVSTPMDFSIIITNLLIRDQSMPILFDL